MAAGFCDDRRIVGLVQSELVAQDGGVGGDEPVDALGEVYLGGGGGMAEVGA
jgi:hypothetical protein